MVHLNELWDKYKDKGVIVIGLTNEPRGLVDAFVAKRSPKYPIIIESSDSMARVGGTAFPTQFAIAPDGKIAGDNFDERLIADLLPKQHIRPALPAALSAVQKLFDKDKVADARKALEQSATGKFTDDEKKSAADIVKWIDETGTALLADAAASEAALDYGAAAETYQDLSTQYAGLDAATKASDALKALLADPAKKKEVDAARALDKARTEASGENQLKKKVALFRAVAKTWKDTKAGTKAAALADELEHPKKK